MSYLLSEYADIRRFFVQSLITRCRDPSVHHELGHYAREQSRRNFASWSHYSRVSSELSQSSHTAKTASCIERLDTREGYRMLEPFYTSCFFTISPQHVRVSPRLERRNKWELSSTDASRGSVLVKTRFLDSFICIRVCELFFSGIYF